MPQPRSGAVRLTALDGLRGWASLSVASFHFTWETFGARFPEFRYPLLALFLDGRLAVATFFGISAYVLTYDSWRTPDKTQVRRRLLKRYPRLALPVIACTLLVFAILALGLNPNREAAEIVNRNDWGGIAWGFDPNVLDALRYGFWAAFTQHPGNNYNPFLWTMFYELWGSAAVLLLCWWEQRLLNSYAALALVLLLTYLYFPMALPIPLGAMLALAQRDGLLSPGNDGRGSNISGLLLITLGLAVGAIYQVAGHLEQDGPVPLLTALIAAAILLGVVWSNSARRFLEHPISQVLGRYSFPIYLAQFPVLISITSYLIVQSEHAGILNVWTALFIALLSLIATLALSKVLFLPVEKLTTRVGRLLDRGAKWVAKRPLSAQAQDRLPLGEP